MRALMRIEAEFFLEDAELLGTAADKQRTHEQRGADALLELARRVCSPAALVG